MSATGNRGGPVGSKGANVSIKSTNSAPPTTATEDTTLGSTSFLFSEERGYTPPPPSKILGDFDVYYFGKVVEEYKDVLAVCDNLMPEGVQREYSGTGGAEARGGKRGAEGAKADAQRKVSARESAQEDNDHVTNHKKKKAKREKDIEETASVALDAATSRLGLPDGGLGALFQPSAVAEVVDAPSWQESKEGIESRAAKIDLSNKLLTTLRQLKNDIKEEENKGPDADEEELGFLRGQLKKVRSALEKDKDENL